MEDKKANVKKSAQLVRDLSTHPNYRIPKRMPTGPCPCACNSGGFCGGCGHAGCGGRR